MNQDEANKWVIFWSAVTVLTVIVLLFFMVRSCNKKYDTKSITSHIEAKAAKKKLESDSIKRRIEPLKDTVIIYRDRWHKTKIMYDTLYKRDTIVRNIIQVCDSALVKDSTLISELEVKGMVDSMIISAQNLIIDRKNAAIEDTVRYYRRKKIGAFFKGLGLGFAAGVTAGQLTK